MCLEGLPLLTTVASVGVPDEVLAFEGRHPQLHSGDGVWQPVPAATASVCRRDTTVGAETTV